LHDNELEVMAGESLKLRGLLDVKTKEMRLTLLKNELLRTMNSPTKRLLSCKINFITCMLQISKGFNSIMTINSELLQMKNKNCKILSKLNKQKLLINSEKNRLFVITFLVKLTDYLVKTNNGS